MMDYLRYCITPREKKCDENSVKETGNASDSKTKNYSASYNTHHSRNHDDLPNTNPINIDSDFFLCSHCYSNCVGNYRDSYTCNIFCSDKDTFSHHQQKKYADDGSFLMFHIRVLFCLE